MVELRWVERSVWARDGDKVERVLQYRQHVGTPRNPTLQNASGIEIQWSDWQDVPTVREE